MSGLHVYHLDSSQTLPRPFVKVAPKPCKERSYIILPSKNDQWGRDGAREDLQLLT